MKYLLLALLFVFASVKRDDRTKCPNRIKVTTFSKGKESHTMILDSSYYINLKPEEDGVQFSIIN